MRDAVEMLALVGLFALATFLGTGCIHRHQIKVCSGRPHTHQGAPSSPSVFIPCNTDTDCAVKNGGEY